MNDARENISTSRLATLTNRRLAIEADEPPILRMLDTLCHNELLCAMGQEDEIIKVGFWHRCFAQIFHFHAYRLG